jgi:hypothetical protein
MSAVRRLRERFAADPSRKLKLVGATGQLGYGIPAASLAEALKREPDMLGADMGSTDIGPTFLGNGQMATSPEQTRRDLAALLKGARALDIPLIIGSAGSAGAGPHLDATLAMVREIAAEQNLHFKLAVIRSDMPRDAVKAAVRAGQVESLGLLADLTEAEVDAAAALVGQAGTEAFVRALELEPDVIIAGRACDTGIYAAIPQLLGFPLGPVMHMAKIIECASLCCDPGGRDPILAVLDHDGFVLESMNPDRRATPMSVAAHSLYEQADPNEIIEPEGRANVASAKYEAVDERCTRVSGATWHPAAQMTVKLEGATRVGERAVLLAGSADPRFIAGAKDLCEQVKGVVQNLVCAPGEEPDYSLNFRLYGLDAVYNWPEAPATPPREIFVMAEVIADTSERAMTVAKSTKQYLLHHGFPGRLSTSGNLAFPFTPPELVAGTAYRFSAYHVMAVDDLAPLFPVTVEKV